MIYNPPINLNRVYTIPPVCVYFAKSDSAKIPRALRHCQIVYPKPKVVG